MFLFSVCLFLLFFPICFSYVLVFFPIFFQGYPSYGYFPAAAGAGGPANGIAGGGGGGASNGGGGGNTPGGERSGSQPSAATYYDYTNGGGPAAFHRGPGLDQHNPAGNMGNSPLLRDAYTGRSGQLNKKTTQQNLLFVLDRLLFLCFFFLFFISQSIERKRHSAGGRGDMKRLSS